MARLRTVQEFLALRGADAPTPAERALVEAWQNDQVCVLGDGKRPTKCSGDRRVRADLLRLLILGGTDSGSPDAVGLWLVGAWIVGELSLRFEKGRGRVVLKMCHFEEMPLIRQAQFDLLSFEGCCLPGLYAQGIKVGSSVCLKEIIASGTISFNEAEVTGNLDCSGASIDGGKRKDGTKLALTTEHAKFGQGLHLCKVTATGEIDVKRAEIGGPLDCTGASLDGGSGVALNAERVCVKEGIVFQDLKAVSGDVILTSACVGDLEDDMASWKMITGKYDLDGLTYERISGAPLASSLRLKWLENAIKSTGKFTPQPFTQLAQVLENMGLSRDAKNVLLRRDRLTRQHERSEHFHHSPQNPAFKWARRAGMWVFDDVQFYVVGYGRAPGRAGYVLTVLFGITWWIACATWENGDFAPNSAIILESDGWKSVLRMDAANPADIWSKKLMPGQHWETFNPFAWGADLILPLDLGQTATWQPTTARGYWGWYLWWARWPLQLIGWIVSALGVAAITGIMQRDRG